MGSAGLHDVAYLCAVNENKDATYGDPDQLEEFGFDPRFSIRCGQRAFFCSSPHRGWPVDRPFTSLSEKHRS